jgi:hypothetical protein
MRTLATFWQSGLPGYAPVRVTVSLLFAFSCASLCLAQDVSVLLLDIRNGHPIQNGKLSVQFHVSGTPGLQTLEANTAPDGTAKFHVATPTPPQLAIGVGSLYPCFNMFPNDMKEILNTGIVSRCSKPPQGCRCKFTRKALGVKAEPGQIVLFARPLTRWERFLSHTWE